MQTQRHYPNAPIIEAIIDFRVTVREGFSVEEFRQIEPMVEPDYTIGLPIRSGNFQITIGSPASLTERLVGYRFVGANQPQQFQATTENFTFNRLAPYTKWEEFFPEARRLWTIYRNACEPLQVTRTSVRFVNRLDLPGPRLEFKDYVLTYPEIAPTLPQSVTNYFMQIQTPVDEPDCILVSTQALLDDARPDVISIILDFEVSKEQIWEVRDDGPLWQFVDSLRAVKNRAFEDSITDQTRELMK